MIVYKFWDKVNEKYLEAHEVYPCSSMNIKTEWVQESAVKNILDKVYHYKKENIELHKCELKVLEIIKCQV